MNNISHAADKRPGHRAVMVHVVHICLVATFVLCGASQVAQAQAPSVGSSVSNPAVLGRLFSAVCLQSPSLPETQRVLADAGMVPNPETGTYFHQQFDMSVNPAGDLCSMVFLGENLEADPEAFRDSAERAAGSAASEIEIRLLDEQTALYFRASVEGRW